MTHRDIIDWHGSCVHITDSWDEQLQTLSPPLFVSRVKQTITKRQLTKYGLRPVFFCCCYVIPCVYNHPMKSAFLHMVTFPHKISQEADAATAGHIQTTNIKY